MGVLERTTALKAELTEWRHDIHAHPETAFEEHRTAALVAEKLRSFGLEAATGVGRTGVVGTLSTGAGPSIGLRADMDALPIQEANTFAHRSRHDGKMHACGHDGHTTMLLGAAKALSEHPTFCGTVQFIFQPAEENEGGGRAMVEDGLFDRFPADRVFAMHNWPGQAAGCIAVSPGPMMASADNFAVTVQGQGAHAAMPHLGLDPTPIAAEIITALQTVVTRKLDPLDPAILTVTRLIGGTAWNAIPEIVELGGTVRCFRPEVRDQMEAAIKEITTKIAEAHGAQATVGYNRRYPPTVNDAEQAGFAADVAAGLVGPENVVRDPRPSMGAEDFSFMLEKRPGAYIWIGNGPGADGCMLHNPHYDFNDDILPLGVAYWVRMVETALVGR